MSIIGWLVLFALASSIGVTLFTYAIFWYENAGNIRFASNPGKISGRTILRGMCSGFSSLFAVMASYPFGFIRPLWSPGKVDPSTPVCILVHGLYHNASAWALFRHRLKKAGTANIFVMNYGSFFTSFENLLRRLEQFVEDARMKVPNQPVILVGHSLGGLLSRVYAERCAGGKVPKGVITLGTPHQGSRMAAFGIGRLAASLYYRGTLFSKLEHDFLTIPCPAFALLSPVDNLVMPEQGLKAPYEGWQYRQTSPVSHVGMLYSKSISMEVIALLRELQERK